MNDVMFILYFSGFQRSRPAHSGLHIFRLCDWFSGSDCLERLLGNSGHHSVASWRNQFSMAIVGQFSYYLLAFILKLTSLALKTKNLLVAGNRLRCDCGWICIASAGENRLRSFVRGAAPYCRRFIPVSVLLRHGQPLERCVESA